jgi:uncharacterized protein
VREVPVFPLEHVLFPRTPLALRIFEERYLVMLGRLLDARDPSFGVVLIERGSEVGGGEQRFGVGTLARLERLVPQQGPIPVIARGTMRFEVDEWLDDDPYPRARIRPLEDLVWNDALQPLLDEAEAIVRRVLGRVSARGATRWDPSIELSDDPDSRMWQLAAIAPLGTLDQLELLQATSAGGLLRATIDSTLAAEELFGALGEGDDTPSLG